MACLAAMAGVRTVYDRAAGGFGFDFYQFWLGGDVLRAHEAAGKPGVLDFYTDAAHYRIGERYLAAARNQSRRQQHAAAERSVVDTASSPFFYWIFSVITPGDYDRDYNVYIVVSLACLVGVIAGLAWRLGYSFAAVAAAIALAAYSAPVYSDFGVVNLNFPELAVCCLYLFLRGLGRRGTRSDNSDAGSEACRRAGFRGIPTGYLKNRCAGWPWLVLAGGLMGSLTAFKPNLLLLPVLLGLSAIASGRWRRVVPEAGGFLVGLALAVGVSSWAFGGVSCWAAWGRVVLFLGSRPSMPSEFGNFSLTRNVYEATGRNLTTLFSAVSVLLSIGAVWLGRRSRPINPESPIGVTQGGCDREFRHDLAIFGIAVAATLLSSGLAWVHYPIQLFPFLLLVGSPVDVRRIGLRTQIVRYGLLAAVVVLLLYPSEEVRRLLPFRIEVSIRAWLHCNQAAVGVAFGLALWFEAILLEKLAPLTNPSASSTLAPA